ncbi:helix-turn-helix domain-containing protein [Segnochrobactrum spirostomi]|nr:helix-turn-helix domain-containing protein [Segnochrobactrum spirostomi]
MITVRLILRIVAEAYDVDPAEIVSQRMRDAVIWPRQLSMWLARQLTDQSLPQIGRAIGGRDHTTIRHGIERVEEILGGDPIRAAEATAIAAAIEKIAAADSLSRPVPGDIDAHAVAARVLARPSAATTISADEIRALAAAVFGANAAQQEAEHDAFHAG